MTRSADQPPALPESGRLLVVGLGNGGLAPDLAASGQTIAYLSFAALDAGALRLAAPDLVVCALFTAHSTTCLLYTSRCV